MALPNLATDREPLGASPRSLPLRVAEAISVHGPALIVLTLPLEFTARYLGQPLVRWVMLLCAIALGYLIFTGATRIALPRQASAVWLGAFVAISVVSWLVTRAPGSYKAVGDVVLYPVFGVMVMNLVLDERSHRRAWIAFLISGFAVALLGLVLQASHLHIWTPNPIVATRLNITFADPNITARFLTIVAVAATVLFATRRAPAWLCLAAGAACAVVLPLTWSRSGLVLFAVSALMAAAVAAPRRRSIAFAVALLALFITSTAINSSTRLRAIDTYNTFVSLAGVTGVKAPAPQGPSEANDTVLADNRRYLVEAGVRMFHDHPVFGVGYGAFQHELSSTSKAMIPPNLPNPDVASHTGFVTIASEMGIAGLLIFVGFLLQLAREAWRERRDPWVLLPATLLVPILMFSQFEGRLIEEPYLWLCLALLYAAARARTAPRITSHTM